MAIGAPTVYGNQVGVLDCGEITEGGLRRGGGRASMHLEGWLKGGEGRKGAVTAGGGARDAKQGR
jgi:hypothetical protein